MPSIFMRRPHLRDLPAVPPLPVGYDLREAAGEADVPALASSLSVAFPEEPWSESDARQRLTAAPDAFIRGTAEDLVHDPAGFVEIGGDVFARGKDPYFAPWPDVIQVDAFAPSLRSLAAQALERVLV